MPRILGEFATPMPGEILGGLRMERDGGRSEVADLLKKNLGKRAAVGIGKGQESGDMKGFAGNGALSLYIIVRSPFSRGFSPEVFSRVEKNFSGPYISAAKASLTCPGYLGIHLGELIALFPE